MLKRYTVLFFLIVINTFSFAQSKEKRSKSTNGKLNTGLILFCDFNEGKGSLLTDYSGNNYHGQIAGLPQSGWILGNNKNKAEGTDRAIDLSYANRSVSFAKLNSNAGQYTISLWLMPGILTNSTTEQIIINAGNQYGPQLAMQENGKLVFRLNEHKNAVLFSSQKLKPYQWQHAAVTVDNTANEVKFYISGTFAGNKKFTEKLKLTIDSSFVIGKKESETKSGFDGVIDDVLLYSRILSVKDLDKIANGELPQRGAISVNEKEEKWKKTSPAKTVRTEIRRLDNLDENDFPANPLDKEGYSLAVHDEFNGPKLDSTIWIPYYLRQRVSDEAGLADYEFRDGSIVLKIEQNKENYNNNGMRVSSLQTLENPDLHKPGKRKDIPTQKKFVQQYGYFEIRAKTQAHPGHCSSFWLLGEGGQQVNPEQTGEIDVIEQPGNLGPNSVAFNLYDWSDSTLGTRITNMGWQNRLRLNKDLTKTFNIYGCEWTPTETKFYFNNQLINIIPASPQYPMGVFLSLYEGNDWFGNLSPQQVFPKEFVIDYFRAWQKK